MRIYRNSSRDLFRGRRRRGGCLPLFVLLGVLLGVAAVSLNRLWLNLHAPHLAGDLGMAERAFLSGDLDTSIALAEQALREDPESAQALALLVRALIYRSYADYDSERDRASALELTLQALRHAAGSRDPLAAHAFALHAAGFSEEAGRTALRVIERQPENALARLALALSYGGQGLFEVALREALRAVELAEHEPGLRADAYRALAIAYSDLGRYHEAITAVETAISHNPRLLALYYERALYAQQVGDTDAATVAYFQVLAYQPENVKARLRLCELSSALRERDAAISYCGQVTALAPAWAEGWYRLGREYYLQGDFRAAQAAFNRCTALQVVQSVPVEERRFDCWYLQGQAAELLGDCEGLLATYEDFLHMTAGSGLPQTWTYPPEGPAICLTPTAPG